MDELTLEYINNLLTNAVYNNLTSLSKDSPYKLISAFLKQWMIIYQIKNIVNNKVYIGSSGDKSPLSRLKRHANDLSKGTHCNKHLQNAYNKYGKDGFEYIILELIPRSGNLVDDLKTRENIEQQYINQTQCANYCFGYNEATHVHGGFNNCNWETLESRTGIKPEQLKQYFILLSETNKTFVEIDKEVGLGRVGLAYKIYFGYSFRLLASEYSFKHRNPRDCVKGENSSSAKLTNKQAQEIINILLNNTSCTFKSIGDKYGISRATVRDIYKKRNWKHLTQDIQFPLRDFEKNQN